MSASIQGFRVPRVLLAFAGAVLCLAAFSPAAQAKTTQPSKCSYPNATQVFSQWNDQGHYELAPEGGLEGGGTGWSLTGGAKLVEANESHFLNGAEDHTALELPYGATATSPPVCVDETTPDFRVMDENLGAKGSKLHVTVTYTVANGTKTQQTDAPPADKGWEPTPPLQLQTDGEAERVARITFSSKESKGDFLVDDLYVDPFARH